MPGEWVSVVAAAGAGVVAAGAVGRAEAEMMPLAGRATMPAAIAAVRGGGGAVVSGGGRAGLGAAMDRAVSEGLMAAAEAADLAPPPSKVLMAVISLDP